MADYWGVKVEDIFNSMKERFRPEGAKGVDAVFGYDIEGEGMWLLTVRNEKMELEKTDDLSGCVAVMKSDGETFVGVNIGKVDGMSAFTSGKMSVDGNLGEFGKTGKLFRKYTVVKKMTTRDYMLDMFGTVEKRFKKEASKGLDFIIQIEAGGEAGGVWNVTIKENFCKVEDKPAEKPTVTLEIMDAQDWVDLTLGKTDAQTLLASGKGAVRGEIAMAMKWGDLFEKYVDPAGGAKQEQELIVLKKVISVDQKFSTGPVMGKFLNALKDKKILANKCPKCGRMQLPAREVCAECRVRVDEFVEVGPKGQVRYMEYVLYSSPDPLTGETRETPYGMLNILLDGCKGNETFAHLVRRDQIDKIKGARDDDEGTRVRPVWRDNRVGSIFDIEYFEIDE